MDGVDETIGHIEGYRGGLDTLQIAAPPVAIGRSITINAFDKDQPVRIDLQNRVACILGSQTPVQCGIAATPAGG